jgi:uncharacterized protein YndB with AHSA1/START domain
MTKLNVTAEPGSHSIIMTRVFDAPRDLVFRAYTDPKLVPNWWGLEGITTIVDKMDVKKGGVWRYIQRGNDGSEYAFNGVYHDVEAPERVVYTFEFEGMPGHVLLETITFEENNGKTTLTDSSVFQTVEARDGMLSSGMEEGANMSMDRLAKLLQEMSKG